MNCSKWVNNQCSVINELCNCSIDNPHFNINTKACDKCKTEWIDKEPSIDNPTKTILTIIERVNTPINPGFLQQIENYTTSIINYAETGFKNVSEETYQSRLQICQSCENYDSGTNKCKTCGCRMAGESGFVSKLRMAHETCPLNPPKWGPEIQGENIPNQ